MGSSSSKQEVTETEKASMEVRDRQWQEYLDYRPVQDEYMAQATGFSYETKSSKFNNGTKSKKKIVEGGVLNQDGSVRINTSSSQMATEAAATDIGLQQYATGNIDEAIDDNITLATGEAQDSTALAFQDQSNYLTGLDNVAAMGQGMETQATVSQLDQAAADNQSAGQRAINIQQSRGANRQAAGQLAGLGLSAYANNQPSSAAGVDAYTSGKFINPYS